VQKNQPGLAGDLSSVEVEHKFGLYNANGRCFGADHQSKPTLKTGSDPPEQPVDVEECASRMGDNFMHRRGVALRRLL
jgi:hypothetical protein